jgi:hypothetical protein
MNQIAFSTGVCMPDTARDYPGVAVQKSASFLPRVGHADF